MRAERGFYRGVIVAIVLAVMFYAVLVASCALFWTVTTAILGEPLP